MVATERARATGRPCSVSRRRQRVGFPRRVVLESIIWEHEPLAATATFQEQIVRPGSADIVVSILWSRLGTRLPKNFTRPDGARYESGPDFGVHSTGWGRLISPESLQQTS